MDLILYNPKSKNTRSNIQTHKLIRKYKKQGVPFRLKSVLKIEDIATYLEGKDHIDNVILLGGDGTINHLVNQVVNLDVKQDIYLKSNGTGNDFLRTLKNNDKEPQYIMESTYDTGFKTYFINGTGMGIDGYVGYLMHKSKRKGKLAYLINTLIGLIQYIPEELELEVDGEVHNYKKTFIVTMNNGKYFGGGMKISPEANLDDEYLDVIVVHSISKLLILPIFFTIYIGKHVKFKKWVTHFKAKHIKATYKTPQITQADGENYYDITTMEVKSSGKKIHLRHYNK